MRTVQLSEEAYPILGIAMNSVLMHYAAKHGSITQLELQAMREISLKLLDNTLGDRATFLKVMDEVVKQFPPPLEYLRRP